jgi:hypothetical protein
MPAENPSNVTLPPFPPSPDGVARLKHLPTVEACIRYWEAISHHAWETGDDPLVEIATGLKESYEEARDELKKAEVREEKKPAKSPRKSRPSA